MAASISVVLVMVLRMNSMCVPTKLMAVDWEIRTLGLITKLVSVLASASPKVAYSLPTPYASNAHPLCPTARPTQSCKSCRKTSSSAVFTNIKRTLRYETQTSLPTFVDLWRHAL